MAIDYQALYENLCNLMPKPGELEPTWLGRAKLHMACPAVSEEGEAVLRIYWASSAASKEERKGNFDVPLTFAYGGIGLAEIIVSERSQNKPWHVEVKTASFIVGRALAYLEREHGCVCKGPPKPLA